MAKPFSAQGIFEDLKAHSERETRRLALRVLAKLARITPVDTGWARSNWILSVGQPVTEPVGSKDNVTTSAQEASAGRILSYRFSQGSVFISNAVPYINRLNDGSSTQAPRGFVQAAIAQAIAEGT